MSRPFIRHDASRIALTTNGWQVELLPAEAYEVSYVASNASIGVAFDSQRGTHAFASDRLRPFFARSNGLAYVPRGCDVYSTSIQGGEYLRIIDLTNQRLEQNGRRAFSDMIDRRAIRAARALRRLLLKPDTPDLSEIGEHTTMLALIVHTVLSGDHGEPRATKSMTPNRLKRLDAYIDERLDQKLVIADMANQLSLSEGFFIRAFKAATGVGPHSYLIDRRIARARRLLHDSHHNLSEIALASGFSSHAHMSACFRERLGVSPQQLRSSRK